MEKQFVTYEIALKLKELGFDEPCFAYFKRSEFRFAINVNDRITCRLFILKDSSDLFNEDCIAPLWQQAIEWFRDKFNIVISIFPIEKFSESHLNNWINLMKIHYSYEIFTINVRQINMEIINKARIMIGDKSTNNLIFTDDTLNFICYNIFDNYSEASKQAILKAIEICQNKKS